LTLEDCYLTPEILDQFIDGTYQINGFPTTDGLFWIEYSEEEFAQLLYDSIGFLGRNFRYRCIEQLSNKKIECVVIDTMGIDARIKSILSDYHGR
jgi:RecB family endonuclease NucS